MLSFWLLFYVSEGCSVDYSLESSQSTNNNSWTEVSKFNCRRATCNS